MLLSPTLLRSKPTANYCGLTVVMSNPSRFDYKQLLSGYAGQYFDECLSPIHRSQCDIRLFNDPSPLLPNTKVVLCFGIVAAKHYFASQDSTILEVRGSPILKSGVVFIASISPQDGVDIKASYEKNLNKNTKEYLGLETPANSGDGDECGDDSDAKRTYARTSRSNFKFWLKADITKAKQLLRPEVVSALVEQTNFSDYRVYPPLEEAINALLTAKTPIVLDIETSPNLDLWCVGFGTTEDKAPVYVVPVFDYTKSLAYSNIPHFLRALSICMLKNGVIAHNAMFDLFVLASCYNVSFGRNIFDTMLAAHRLEPEIEKSLGHCISLYTLMPYHKNEGNFQPCNKYQQEALWSYNGKDVYTTRLLYHKLKLQENASVKQVNASIYPYLLMELFGISYDDSKVKDIISLNDRYMTQYLRLLRVMTGYNLLPSSPKSCTHYYHDILKYKVVKRSKKTKAPSLDEKAMLTLAVSHDHPTIPLVLEYRRLKRQTGQLKFKPWNQYDESTNLAQRDIRKELYNHA